MNTNIGRYAIKLAKNPIGIFALFVVLIEGVVTLPATFGDLSNTSETALVIFIVTFPILVLYGFLSSYKIPWPSLCTY